MPALAPPPPVRTAPPPPRRSNWLAIRVRNATHNFIYVESFGSGAASAAAPGAPGGKGKGVFECVEGDLCQTELYEYGPITSDYPHYPVMTDERWCLDNAYRRQPKAVRDALHEELKHAYCSTRRLGVDRMGCDSAALVEAAEIA